MNPWTRRSRWGDAKEAREEYARLRNQTVWLSRKEKRQFERDIALRNSKEDVKPFWSLCNKRLKTRKGVAPLLRNSQDPNSITFNDKEKADSLQAQFISVLTREPEGEIPQLGEQTQARLSNFMITPEAVMKKLKALLTNRACGPDEVHPLLLKELAVQLSPALTYLFKESLRQGAVPSDWKSAIVSPIYKKGATHLPVNYRPVSLTCIVCKIMESLVREAIVAHCEENNLLSSRQFGFIGKRSTTLQLLNYVDFCAGVAADRGVTDAVYLDFAKAFDTVPHKRLLGKLQAYGIDQHVYRWIQDFLVGRVQRVSVNGSLSEEEPVISGIPQGSVLGPLLFVIFINDLPQNLTSQSLMFADDTKVFSRVSNRDEAQALQRDLNELEQWSNTWLLKFHPDKCKVLSIGRFEDGAGYYYTLFGQLLEHIDEEKDVGVMIDSELSFENHINAKVSKANQVMGLIRSIISI